MRRAKTTVSLKSALEPKPEWRGWLHAYGFFVSLGLGIALVAAARTEDAVVAASIYAFSLSALLGTSALYHPRADRGHLYAVCDVGL